MEEQVYNSMNWPRIEAIIYGEEASPRDVMTPQVTQTGVLIQGYFPTAEKVTIVYGKASKKQEMIMEDEAGYFAAEIPVRKIPAYHFVIETKDGKIKEEYDPYAFPGQISEEDEKKFLSGIHYDIYRKLGAHPAVVKGTEGTAFAVWAPNAVTVSVVGDFNDWDGRRALMHRLPMSGIFELFLPQVKAGDIYKYQIKTKSGEILLKADPYAFQAEMPPKDASVVSGGTGYSWQDESWLQKRKGFGKKNVPLYIYEVDLETEAKEEEKTLNYRELAEKIGSYVKEMGYTHVELHPVMEYLNDQGKGYSTSSYYAPTRRYGQGEDFKYFVDWLHKEEIGVIVDWTPAQFPKGASGLEQFDGTLLYEKKNENENVHPFWDTLLYDYGSPMVKNFLIANALYWIEEYHLDGLRMDDVDAMLYLDYGRTSGNWTPNLYGTNENLEAVEFLKHLNSLVKKQYPEVLLIAQEDGLWPDLTESVEEDHLGFDYKWSGGWIHDFMEYLVKEPVYRKDYHDQLTLSMLYAYSEEYILPMGTRDVGCLKELMEELPGSASQKGANARLAYGYQMVHPGKKMQAADRQAPEPFKEYLKALVQVYKSCPALYEKDDDPEGFEWIQLMNYEQNVLAFLRKTEKKEETLLVLCNFADVTYEKYQVGVPEGGRYKEIFNSDRKEFGGNGVLNPRVKVTKKEECDERDYSITVKLPALSLSIFQYQPAKVKKAVSGKTAKTGKKAVK